MVETVKERAADSASERSISRAETRREQRRALIIAAAGAELEESGLAGITLAAVGDRVGLSKGALYYYVDSRDALLALVLDDALEAIRLEAAAAASAGAPPLDRLAAFARAHLRYAVERPAGSLIANSVAELAAHDRTAELLRGHTAALVDIVRDAVGRGDLRDVPPTVAVTAFFATLNSLSRTFDRDGELGFDELVDAALDLLLVGWRPRDDPREETS